MSVATLPVQRPVPVTSHDAIVIREHFLNREDKPPARLQGLVNLCENLLQRAEIAQHIGRNDQWPTLLTRRHVSYDVSFAQIRVKLLGAGVCEHSRRKIYPGQRAQGQIPDRQRDQAGAAPQVEHWPKGKTSCEVRVILQEESNSNGNTISQCNQMAFKPIGVAVKDGTDVLFGGPFGARNCAERGHQMTHVGVFRTEFLGVLVGTTSVGK